MKQYAWEQFYNPNTVGDLRLTDLTGATEAAFADNLLVKRNSSPRSAIVIGVDMQGDFIYKNGTLSVNGAVEDTDRSVRWLYRNAASIKALTFSLDTHLPHQIFTQLWWRKADGSLPDAWTIITLDEVQRGIYTPVHNPAWSIEYLKKLEQNAKKQLMLWPFHAQEGTPGRALVPAVSEAIQYWAALNNKQPTFYTKGTDPDSEKYAIFEPEVKTSHPDGGIATAHLDKLKNYDDIYIMGQAKSHCVLETIESIVRYFGNNSALLNKIVVMTDCMSSVAHPTVDFDGIANKRYTEFGNMGLRFSNSTIDL